MSTRRRGKAIGAGALVSSPSSSPPRSESRGGGRRAVGVRASRAQTFYMSGNQWSPYGDVNPAKTWDYSTGTVGLAYETISVQPPGRCVHPMARHGGTLANEQRLRHEHPPWREVQRRQDALTPRDVKYSFDL